MAGMNLKENKKGYLREFQRTKWKEMWCGYIIISRNNLRTFFFSVARTATMYSYLLSHRYRHAGYWATASLDYSSPFTQRIMWPYDMKSLQVISGYCVKKSEISSSKYWVFGRKEKLKKKIEWSIYTIEGNIVQDSYWQIFPFALNVFTFPGNS